MRYPADHKEQTRKRIVAAASAAFRRSGYEATGVDRVMADAGLTPGGFYAHFGSKAELFAEAFARTLREATAFSGDVSGAAWLQGTAGRYLSDGHRRHPEAGCPLPPLLAEVARADDATRDAFEAALVEAVDAIAVKLGTSREAAYPILATLVGGMSLARAVRDDRLAGEILAACRASLEAAAPAEPRPARRPSRRNPKRPKGPDR